MRHKVDPSFEVCWACGTTPDGIEDPTFRPADAEPLPARRRRSRRSTSTCPAGDKPLPEPLVAGVPRDLVECYWAMDLMQAKFLADQLSEQGIPAVADTHDLHDAPGEHELRPPRLGPRRGPASRLRLARGIRPPVQGRARRARLD